MLSVYLLLLGMLCALLALGCAAVYEESKHLQRPRPRAAAASLVFALLSVGLAYGGGLLWEIPV